MSQYPPQGQQNPPDQPQQQPWQKQPSQSLPPSQPSGQWKQPIGGNQSGQQFRGQWRQPMQPDMFAPPQQQQPVQPGIYPPSQQQPMQQGIYPPPQQQQPRQPDMFPPPQQQQPRQQGMFPPPQQQQPRPSGMFPPPQKPMKRSLRNLWIVVGGIAVLLIVCAGIAAAMNGGANSADPGAATQVPTTQVAITGTAQSQSITATVNQHYKVGQVIKVNSIWQVTINSVKTTNGDTFSTPAAGNTYFTVDVTLMNLSGQAQNISSALNFSLHDGTGQKYTETILTGETPPDGKVAAGALLHGQLTYEVSTAQTFFTLNFEPDLVTGGLTIWDLQK